MFSNMVFNLKRTLFNAREEIFAYVVLNYLHINKSHCMVQAILEEYKILISFIFMYEKYFPKQGFSHGNSIFWVKDRDNLNSAFSVTSR